MIIIRILILFILRINNNNSNNPKLLPRLSVIQLVLPNGERVCALLYILLNVT